MKRLIDESYRLMFEAMANKDRFAANCAMVSIQIMLTVKARQENKFEVEP